MVPSHKSRAAVLEKLNITTLNPMQEEALEVMSKTDNVVLLSPTGTGKTLAFALPLLERLNPDIIEIQALIVVPTRELAIQIEQVFRTMGSGYKVNAVYGGRARSKDKIELKHKPAVLIGTPGRVNDHFQNELFSTKELKTLVLDEFDKSLEIGFENEMRSIINRLDALTSRILTSATDGVAIPNFVGLKPFKTLNYLIEKSSKLSLKTVISPDESKLTTLLEVINHTQGQHGIVFCNLKESIQTVSDFLRKHSIAHGCFNGGMEQKDRERALIKFRNGTCPILVATDLAARGIDVPEMEFIIHYELPIHEEEFIHRNGRTARVSAQGTAYILKWKNQHLPHFIFDDSVADISKQSQKKPIFWETLFISGGRKDKISKGDIAGLFIKQGNITKDQLGIIELKVDCAFVAVPKAIAAQLANKLNNSHLKKKKVRIYLV